MDELKQTTEETTIPEMSEEFIDGMAKITCMHFKCTIEEFNKVMLKATDEELEFIATIAAQYFDDTLPEEENVEKIQEIITRYGK